MVPNGAPLQAKLTSEYETHMGVSWNRGTPSYHPFSIGIFPYKPSSYWGTPMTMETPTWFMKSKPAIVWVGLLEIGVSRCRALVRQMDVLSDPDLTLIRVFGVTQVLFNMYFSTFFQPTRGEWYEMIWVHRDKFVLCLELFGMRGSQLWIYPEAMLRFEDSWDQGRQKLLEACKSSACSYGWTSPLFVVDILTWCVWWSNNYWLFFTPPLICIYIYIYIQYIYIYDTKLGVDTPTKTMEFPDDGPRGSPWRSLQVQFVEISWGVQLVICVNVFWVNDVNGIHELVLVEFGWIWLTILLFFSIWCDSLYFRRFSMG